jgi:hypothetical protein
MVLTFGAAVIGAWLTVAASSASAQVIYDDSFSYGTASSPIYIQGYAPTVVDGNAGYPGTGGGTWSFEGGLGSFQANGSAAVNNYGAYSYPYLPFTPAAGKSFTLSATVANLVSGGGSGNAVHIGFSSSNANGLFRGEGPSSGAVMGESIDGDGNFSYDWQAGGYVSSIPGVNLSIPHALMITVDGSTGTVSCLLDGSTMATQTFSPAAIASILNVDMGHWGDAGATISNFVLSGPVASPEPASLTLLAMGGLLALPRRRHPRHPRV